MKTERLKLAIILLAGLVCCAMFLLPRSSAQSRKRQPPPPAPAPGSQAPIDYERFTHKSHTGQVKVPNTNQARELKCDSCHERTETAKSIVATTDRNQRLRLKFPGHKTCVECHVVQFTARPQLTCTICHETKQGLNARPPQTDFPQRYDFNAFFDGKQHELHAGYSFTDGRKLECVSCHQPTARPSSLTIASHPECYVCHAPASGDPKAAPKSGCAVCHTTMAPGAQPFSEKLVSRAYGALFTHKAHVNYVRGDCNACHTINGGYNQPAPTSLRVKQHLGPNERSGRGCFSCHDGAVHYGRTVFSGEPGATGGGSCQKCHTRNDYKVFPTP
ncbi:MAG: cytochrome c3 family protein [Blastocatellia bacterium]